MKVAYCGEGSGGSISLPVWWMSRAEDAFDVGGRFSYQSSDEGVTEQSGGETVVK